MTKFFQIIIVLLVFTACKTHSGSWKEKKIIPLVQNDNIEFSRNLLLDSLSSESIQNFVIISYTQLNWCYSLHNPTSTVIWEIDSSLHFTNIDKYFTRIHHVQIGTLNFLKQDLDQIQNALSIEYSNPYMNSEIKIEIRLQHTNYIYKITNADFIENRTNKKLQTYLVLSQMTRTLEKERKIIYSKKKKKIHYGNKKQ